MTRKCLIIIAAVSDHIKIPHLDMPGAVFHLNWSALDRFVLPEWARALTLETTLRFAGTRYILYVAVVMPDHVHLLLNPLPKKGHEFYKVSSIVHSVKSYTAHAVNESINHTGGIWQQGYFDRIIRSGGQDFEKTWQYILDNPVRSGLSRRWEDYPYLWTSGMENPYREHRPGESPGLHGGED